MKLKSRIIGSSMVLALALGMSAAPSFGVVPSSPPVAATGNLVFPQGTQTSRGVCTGMLLGSLWNATKTQGLSNILGPITSSSKGTAGSAANAAALSVGACLIDGRVGITGGTGGVYGAKTITKSGTKLTSTGTRCGNDANGNTINFETAAVPVGDFEPLQRPLAGKFSYAFSDFTKMDAFVRVQGFDSGFADVVWLTGIVTKGEAVGSTIGGNIWFNPVFKTTLATLHFAESTANDFVHPFSVSGTNPTGASRSYAPGWGGSSDFATGIALGCLAQAIPMGIGITTIAIGGGNTSPLLGATTSGIQFLT